MTPAEARNLLAEMETRIAQMEADTRTIRAQYDKFKALVEEHLQTIEK